MLALLTYHMLRSREAQQILALHKMRDQYALIVEGSSDGIIGKNLQGVVTSWNPAAERIFGYSAEEAVGHKLFDLVFPDDTEEEELAILRDIAAGKAVPDHEAVRVRKDGSLVFVSVAISPIWNLSGEIIGASKTVRDITALRDAEHAVANINAKLEMEVLRRTSVLRDAQEALRTVLDALPSMIGYWDCNLINRVANKAYERWFGVSADQITGQCLISLLGPELYEQNRPYIEKVLRGEAQTFERMIEHRDGSVRFALSHYLPDMADGEVRGFFVVVHDITEISESRIRLANSLHENEVLLGTINQQLLYSVADEQGMFIEVNDMFCQSMGYGREALIGHDHKIVQSGVHDAAFYRQMWAALMKGQAWRGELCNRCQNGVLKWFDTVIAPLGEETSGSKRFLALQIDITDRRQAMAEVDRLNLMLRNVLDAASEISIIATDADGTIALFNRGAERMLGYSADEMIGKQTPAIIHDAAEIHQRGEELSQQYGEPVEGFRVFVHVPEQDGAEIHDWTYIRKDQHRLTVSWRQPPCETPRASLPAFWALPPTLPG
jgi:PAS domain S-box-containing protein